MSSVCTPALLFGVKVAKGNDKSALDKLCYSYNRTWSKIFNTFDKNIWLCCQFYSGFLLLVYQIDLGKILFARSTENYLDLYLAHLFPCFSNVQHVLQKYGVLQTDSIVTIKTKLYSHFERSPKDARIV